MKIPNAQVNIAAPASLPVRIAARARRRMFETFMRAVAPAENETVLDVGVTSDRSYEASNYFEAWYPHKEVLTAVGLDDAGFLQRIYPGVRFVRADGKRLPFGDRRFDVVHSSAVIEHVGSRREQARFLEELCRVAARAVFLTTPNRWFPIEFHTLLPLVHWLPQPLFHTVLRLSGRAAFASEDVLNLLDSSELLALAPSDQWRGDVLRLRLGGVTSNLMLLLERQQ